MDDREILKQFEKRSETAIEACTEKYGRILSRIAFNVLGSEEDAEECVNDALLRVWNSVPPEAPADLAAYLCRITRNLSIDRLRANKALRRGGEILQAETELLECLPARDDVERELEEKEFTALLDRFLEGLKPHFEELLVVVNGALTEEGRKNGKTTEMAGVSIDLLVNDREGAPEIYFIATARDQAKKGFDEAVRMVRQSSDLNDNILKRQTDLYFSANEGIIKPLASNTNSLDGYDLMKQSMSSRRNPLLFCITTNGFVRHGIYDAQHDYAVRVLDGMIEDEHFLPFLYGLDDRDEWADESAWIKANPGYGTIKQKSFLMSMVEKARVDETFRPTVLVKDFNVTENSSSAWLTWDEVDNDATTDLKFRYCVGGFDAADSVDLNAAKALMIRKDDPNIYVKSMYWLPESVLEQTGKTGSRHERDSVPYELWVKQGLLRTCPGNKCEKSIFLDWFCELREQGLYTLYIGYDPWHIDDTLLSKFKGEFGKRSMVPIRQGAATLSEPMKSLKADLGAHKIIYDNNPIDKWCLMNTELRADINGNIQPVKAMDKKKRIDGTIALLCGYKVLSDHTDDLRNLNGVIE